ncbi:MAG: choice-of-anchor Q domain-containing protein [Thermoguttaceae bacterium]
MPRATASRRRMRFEPLEERSLLSVSNVVTTPTDVVDPSDGLTSFREAIEAANATRGDDTITFAPELAGSKIALTHGELPLTDITGKTTIVGLGADQLAIDGNNASRIFDIAEGVTVDMSGLMLARGNTTNRFGENGAGIQNLGTLTITDCTLSGNASGGNGGAISNRSSLTIVNSVLSGNSTAYVGGAIYNRGVLTIDGCTVSDNATGTLNDGYGQGGGLYSGNGSVAHVFNTTISGNATGNHGRGGGVSNDSGATTLINCTLAGNSAEDGGGFYNSHGIATLANCTVAGNSASLIGGGIHQSTSGADAGTTRICNTIVAGNTTGSTAPDLGGQIQADYSLIRNIAGATISGANNILNQDALLKTLGDYGGRTQTMPLQPGSPAVDTGSNGFMSVDITTDQQGSPRLIDGDNDGVACVDMGAVEAAATSDRWIPDTPTSGQTRLDASPSAGGTTVTVVFTFPSAGYRVSSWGAPVCDGNTFTVNTEVKRWTGPAAQIVTTFEHSYDLGSLPLGTYTFNLLASQAAVASTAFTVRLPPSLTLEPLASSSYVAGAAIPIQWTAANVGLDAKISLCYDKDTIQGNGNETWITTGLAVAEGSGSYSWSTAAVSPGTYYLTACLTVAGTQTFASVADPVTISPAPTFTISSAVYSAETGEVRIQWAAENLASDATLSLYYDTDSYWNGNEQRFQWDAAVTNGDGVFDWSAFGLPAGKYYIAGYVYSGGTPYYSRLAQPCDITPGFRIAGPTEGSVYAGSTLGIYFAAEHTSPGDKVTLFYDRDTLWNGNETPIEVDRVNPSDAMYVWNTPANLAPGTIYIAGYLYSGGKPIYVHLDGAGVTVKPVTSSPAEFTLTSPVGGTFSKGQAVPIQWTAKNAASGSTVWLCCDPDGFWNGNERWIDWYQAVANGDGAFNWNTASLSPGTYYLGGYLYSGGRPSYSRLSQPITIGATGTPSFTIKSPASRQFMAGQIVPIQWTAANVSAGDKLSLCYDANAGWDGKEHWVTIDLAASNGDGTFNWDTTGLGAGTYYLGGYLYSSGKPIYSHLTQSFAIQTGGPTFSLSSPTGGSLAIGSTVSIAWSAASLAAGSTVSLCYDTDALWNGNEKWIRIDQTVDNGDGTYRWNTAGMTPGVYYLGGYVYSSGRPTYSRLSQSFNLTAPSSQLLASAVDRVFADYAG